MRADANSDAVEYEYDNKIIFMHDPFDRHLPDKVLFDDPVRGMMNLDIVSIATGTSHMMAMTSDGEIYSWGGHNAMQLGMYPHKYLTKVKLQGPLTVMHPHVVEIESGLIPRKCISKQWIQKNGRPVFLDCQHDSSYLLTQQGNAWIWGSTKVLKRVDMRHYEVCS